MIRISPKIAIDERELEESFVRASGPGRQNVNKLSTAVQLRFDIRHSPSLPPDVAAGLEHLAGPRLTLERLVDLIRRAAVAPVPRRPTKPTKASRVRRIETKKHRGGIKQLRRTKPSFD